MVLTNRECKHRLAWIKIGFAASVAQSLQMVKEPPTALPITTREEYRRTLWSIYLLDKLGACGQNRTPVFHDFTLRLRLPCVEEEFRQSVPSTAPTLQELQGADIKDWSSVSPLARVVVVTSILSQIAHVALQQKQEDMHLDFWDQQSKYLAIHSRLYSICTAVHEPVSKVSDATERATVAMQIFAQTLFHLCHCILQHPFVIKQQWKVEIFGLSPDPWNTELPTCWDHAQSLTNILVSAAGSGLPLWASFYGYCALVAGTLNALYSHSDDDMIRTKSRSALEHNVAFLRNHAKVYRNAGRMVRPAQDQGYHRVIS